MYAQTQFNFNYCGKPSWKISIVPPRSTYPHLQIHRCSILWQLLLLLLSLLTSIYGIMHCKLNDTLNLSSPIHIFLFKIFLADKTSVNYYTVATCCHLLQAEMNHSQPSPISDVKLLSISDHWGSCRQQKFALLLKAVSWPCLWKVDKCNSIFQKLLFSPSTLKYQSACFQMHPSGSAISKRSLYCGQKCYLSLWM